MPDSSPDAGAAPLTAEIERRVGRNLLAYQRIENGLKLLLVRSCVEGTPGDMEQRLRARAAKVMRLNMGEAAKSVFEQVLIDDPNSLPKTPAGTEPVIRSRYTISPHPDYPDAIAALRTQCKAVVDARNDLVHHFLRQTNLQSSEVLHAALAALDAQHDAAQAVREQINMHLRSMLQHQGEIAEYMASDAGQRVLEQVMSEGRVVDVLVEVARAEARADGWTLLSTAQNRVRAAVPADADRLRERLGARWMWSLLERCSDLFETTNEPTPNGPTGSTRTTYRPRIK